MTELRRWKAGLTISAECLECAYDPAEVVRAAATELLGRFPGGYASFHVRPEEQNGRVVATVFVITGYLPSQAS